MSDLASGELVEGAWDDARRYASSLMEKGYQEHDFMDFCLARNLCPAQ